MTAHIRKWSMAACLLLILAPWAATAPAGAAEDLPTLTVKALHSQDVYAPGGSYPLALEITVRPGFHINTHQPKEPDLYPTKVKLIGTPELVLAAPAFPPAKTYKPGFSPTPLEVFDGVFLVRTTLTVTKQAIPGPGQVSALVEFQACDDQACLMPEIADLAIPLTVAKPGQTAKPLNPGVFKK